MHYVQWKWGLCTEAVQSSALGISFGTNDLLQKMRKTYHFQYKILLHQPVENHEGIFNMECCLQPFHYHNHNRHDWTQPVQYVEQELFPDPRRFGPSEEVEQPGTKITNYSFCHLIKGHKFNLLNTCLPRPMQMLLSCRFISAKTTMPSKGTQRSFGIFFSDRMSSSMPIMGMLMRFRRCCSRISRRTPRPLALLATLRQYFNLAHFFFDWIKSQMNFL